jgi:hypothetical protein
MDLSTNYLGLSLAHPLMPGALPMVDDLDTVRRLEDAGAAAIVMHSLFEEQILVARFAAFAHLDTPADAFAEVPTYFPETNVSAVGPDEYLEQLRRIKEAVGGSGDHLFGCGHGGHGRRARSPDGFRTPPERPRTPGDRQAGPGAMAGGARVRLACSDAGEPEPGSHAAPARLRARQLHPAAPELARPRQLPLNRLRFKFTP